MLYNALIVLFMPFLVSGATDNQDRKADCEAANPGLPNVFPVMDDGQCVSKCAQIGENELGILEPNHVVELVGEPVNLPKGYNCDDEKECLAGLCHPSDLIEACKAKLGETILKSVSRDTFCVAKCVGEDGVTETINQKDGTKCAKRFSDYDWRRGTCKQGVCEPRKRP